MISVYELTFQEADKTLLSTSSSVRLFVRDWRGGLTAVGDGGVVTRARVEAWTLRESVASGWFRFESCFVDTGGEPPLNEV